MHTSVACSLLYCAEAIRCHAADALLVPVLQRDPLCSIDGLTASAFYLRAGYSPDDYKGREEWQARQRMEGCNAVSCPSVAYQLVGAKKIQQDLASPGARSGSAVHTCERFGKPGLHSQVARALAVWLWQLHCTHRARVYTVSFWAVCKLYSMASLM